MGGEHTPRLEAAPWRFGSSPRGRGAQHYTGETEAERRIIPAWAGSTVWCQEWSSFVPDHPRVGGEHRRRTAAGPPMSGSSPRGRGARSGRFHSCAVRRIIPAWAGSTDDWPLAMIDFADHPRVGGEHGTRRNGSGTSTGSSPRGRGALADMDDRAGLVRIIPAWAGSTRAPTLNGAGDPDHPRVGGEHCVCGALRYWLNGSSPRGRGALELGRPGCAIGRIIPAWAGSTPSSHTRRTD